MLEVSESSFIISEALVVNATAEATSRSSGEPPHRVDGVGKAAGLMLKMSERREKHSSRSCNVKFAAGSWSELRLNGSMPAQKDNQHTSHDSYEMNGSEGDAEVPKPECPSFCACFCQTGG